MGILTAAIALGLEFIPIAQERYDLVVRKEYFEIPIIKAFLQIILYNNKFRDAVISLGGYDVSDMGKVVYEQ